MNSTTKSKGGLIGGVALLVLLLLSITAATSPTISTEKKEYIAGESVLISIEGELADLTLELHTPSAFFKYLGELQPTIPFTPDDAGEYTLVLSTVSGQLANTSFTLLPAPTAPPPASAPPAPAPSTPPPTSAPTPEPSEALEPAPPPSLTPTPPSSPELDEAYEEPSEEFDAGPASTILAPRPPRALLLRDSLQEEVKTRIQLMEGLVELYDSSRSHSLPPREKLYDITLTPELKNFVEVKLHGVNLTKNATLNLEQIDRSLVIEGKRTVESFALDPTQLDFDRGTVTKRATGRELWKCKDWDFTRQHCFGSWVKIMDLIPGQLYTFDFDALDPGFGETNETINVSVTTDKATYQFGEIVNTTINTTNISGSPRQTNITSDLILADSETTAPWWNTSWKRRKVILLTNELAVDRTSIPVQVNLTGLNGNISNCANEIRVVNRYTNTPIAVTVLDGDDATYCNLQFLANISASATNEERYYAYYNYTAATDPGYAAINFEQSIMFENFNDSSGAGGWATTTGHCGTPAPDPNCDDNTPYGNFTDCVDGGDWEMCTTDDGADLTHNAGDYSLLMTDMDTFSDTRGLIFNMTNLTTLCSGTLCQQINVSFDFTASGLDGVEYCRVWANDEDTTNAQIYQCSNLEACEVGDGTPEPADYNFIPQTNVCGLAGINCSDHTNHIQIHLGGFATANGDRCFWDNVNVTGLMTVNSNASALVGEEQLHILRQENETDSSGLFTLLLDTLAYSLGNYSITVRATNASGALGTGSAFFTLAADTTSPTITLYEPISGLSTNLSTFTFNWTASDFQRNQTCNLTIDGAVNQSNVFVANGLVVNFTISSFSEAVHTWNVTCWDIFNNVNTSATRNFTVTDPPTAFSLLLPTNDTVSPNHQPNMSWSQTTDETFTNYTLIIDTDPLFGSIDFTYVNLGIANTSRVLDSPLTANTIYYWRVIAADQLGNTRNSTEDFVYTTDNVTPSVILNYPSNNTHVTSGSFIFNYTPYDVNLENCTLYGNFTGTFAANQTSSSLLNNQTNNFSITLNDGAYIWNVLCRDSADNTAFAANNFTFFVDTAPPTLNIEGPPEGTEENSTNNIVFEYNVSDAVTNISSCEVVVDGTIQETDTTVTENVTQNFTVFVGNGVHTWYINCTDGNGFETGSLTYNLTVNVTSESDPPIITLNYPAANEILISPNVTFNYTPNDATGILNCSLFIDGSENQSCGYGAPPTIGEAGSASVANFTFVYVNLSGSYSSTPVVIAVAASNNAAAGDIDNSPIPVVKDVSTTGFNISLCVDNASTTCDNDTVADTVHYMVFDVDAVEDLDWIAVGTTANINYNGASNSVSWGKTLSGTPSVFATPQTYSQGNNEMAVNVWETGAANNAGASIIGCKHTAPAGGFSNVDLCDSSGGSTETVGWVAIDVSDNEIENLQFGSADISNSDWTTASFTPNFNDPIVAVLQNDDDGGQDPEYPWARNVNGSEFQFRYCEQDVQTGGPDDDCDTHTSEIVVWMAAERGLITLNSSTPSCIVTNQAPNYFNVTGLTEGLHNWSIQCYDNSTSYNLGTSATRNFTIDITNPVVTLNTPQNNTFWYSTDVTFNYTPVDNTLDACTLYGDFTGSFTANETNSTPANNVPNFFSLPLPDGTYLWNVLCNDSVGRQSFSVNNYTVKVDATRPQYANISLNPTSPATYVPGQLYKFNITWTDVFLDTVILEHNFTGTLTNYTLNGTSGSPFTYNYSDLAGGTYAYRWYANDSAGRRNWTDPLTYIVQTASSEVNLTINGTRGNYSMNEDRNINFTINMVTPSSGFVELYVNGTLIDNGTTPLQNTSFFSTPGTYNITAVYPVTENYSRGSETHFLRVNDTTAPTINLEVPVANGTVGNDVVNFQFVVLDHTPIANCSLYINGTLNQTETNITRNTTESFSVTFPDGDYSWRVDCIDAVGNLGQSETRNFTVFQTTAIQVAVTMEKSPVQQGERANGTTNTTDVFNSPLVTNLTIDVIRANTTTPWWNPSWALRKPLLFTNDLSQDRTQIPVRVNVTGLGGNITTCLNEIRVIQATGLVETPVNIEGGDDDTYCTILFLANVSNGTSGAPLYHVYYNNSGVGNPGYAAVDRSVAIMFEDFGDSGGGDGWADTTGSCATPAPDPNCDDNTPYGNFTDCVDGGDWEMCTTDDGADLSHSAADYALQMGDLDTFSQTRGIIFNMTDLSTLCAGVPCDEINVAFDFTASGLDAGEYCRVWANDQDSNNVELYQCNDLEACEANDGTPEPADYTAIGPIDACAQAGIECNILTNTVRLHLGGVANGNGDRCFWDNFNVTGATAANVNLTVTVDERQTFVERATAQTAITGLYLYPFNTTGHAFDNYSIVALASKVGFDSSANGDQFELIPDTTPPRIFNPTLNTTRVNHTHSVRLNVTVTDFNTITSVNATFLFPNGTDVNFSLTLLSGDVYTFVFNQTFQTGLYNITNIIASDEFGNVNNSAFTDLTFNVTLSPPDPFNLTSPANNTVSGNLLPTMVWGQSADEHFKNYTLLFDQDPAFGTPDFSYSTAPVTNTSKTLDFALEANRLYYWRVVAYDQYGASRNSNQDFIYITDKIPPNITLNSPANNSQTGTASTTFNYTPAEVYNIDTCTLYGNFTGSFGPNVSDSNTTNGQPNLLVTTLPEGEYVWNVRCNDTSSNADFAPANYTLTVDLTPPNITLISPAGGTLENTTNNVVFTASALDIKANVSSCELVVDGSSQQTLNSITDGVQFNFTEFLFNGNYTWQVNCTDDNGNEGSSESRAIEVSVTDTNPPLITLNHPDNGDSFSLANITFNYTPEDATGIFNCSLYIDGTLNQSCGVPAPPGIGEAGSASVANFTFVYINFSRTYANTPVVIAVAASNNAASGDLNNAPIPVVKDVSTTGFNISLCVDNASTTCDNDTVADTVHYMVFDVDEVANLSWIAVGTTDSVNYNGATTAVSWNKTMSGAPSVFATPQTYSQGNNEMAVNVWETGAASTVGGSIIGCKHTAPAGGFSNVNLCDSSGGSTETVGWVAIDVSDSEITKLQAGSGSISNSAWTAASFTPSISNPIVAVLQNSDAGGEDPQYPWARDVTNFDFDFRYCEQDVQTGGPDDDCDTHAAETVVWVAVPQGEITLNNTVATCTIDNQVPNYFNVTGLVEGLHNWSIQCYDNSTGRNLGTSATNNFTIDFTNPVVTLETPGNDTFWGFSSVEFNYTPYDLSLEACVLYANFTSNFTAQLINDSPINNATNTFTKTLDDGTYLWNVLCNDSASRQSFAPENYTVKVDTTPPNFSSNITDPASPATYAPGQVYIFNITVRDSFGVANVTFESNFSGAFTNASVNTSGSDLYSYNTSNLDAGNYSFQWYANDTIGNTNQTIQYTYIINPASSAVNLTLDGIEGNNSINEDNSATFVVESITPSGGFLQLFIDGVQIDNGTSPLTNATLFPNPGIYNITGLYPATQNYLTSSITYFLTVNDTTPPNVTLIFPLNASFVGTNNLNFQYNISDKSLLSNCSLYINGTLNQTDTNVSVNVTETFTDFLPDGNYSWQVRCYDVAGNLGTSTTNNFTVLNTNTTVVNVTTDNGSYEQGAIANITTNTSDVFDSPLVTNVTTDIIFGDTSFIWWNTSWNKRKPILITNQLNQQGHNLIIDVNITGLNGNISSCVNEIRIVEATRRVVLQTNILDGDNSTYCTVRFVGNVSGGVSNAILFHAYYDNPSATNPGFGTIDLNAAIMFEDFGDNTGGDGWADTTGSCATPDPDPNCDDNTPYGNFNACVDGADWEMCTSDDGADISHSPDDYALQMSDLDAFDDARGIIFNMTNLTRLCSGTVCEQVSVTFDFTASGLDGVEYCRVWVNDAATSNAEVFQCDNGNLTCEVGDATPEPADYIAVGPIDVCGLAGAGCQNNSNNISLHLGGLASDNGDRCFWDNVNVTGVKAINSNITTALGQQQVHIQRNESETSVTGTFSFLFNTSNRTLGNYSAVSIASTINFTEGTDAALFEIRPDTTPPNVTLLLPVDFYTQGVGTINFTYHVYDLNLDSCTLHFGLGSLNPNETDSAPTNNQNNTFTDIYFDIGLWDWNVFCNDTAGNGAFSPINLTLNITGADLTLNSSADFYYTLGSSIEGNNATLFANITNIGLSHAIGSFIVQFFDGDPDVDGVQIGSNITLVNLSIGQVVTVNRTLSLAIGLNELYLLIDANNSINESNEENNKFNLNITIPLYQYYYGNVLTGVRLQTNNTQDFTIFGNDTNRSGHVFAADEDSSFQFNNLQAIGRTIGGSPTGNDLGNVDTNLNTTSFNDSIRAVWGGGTETPLQTTTINLTSGAIANVPYVNTTNTSAFITGILWDTADDSSDNQYDTTDDEDLVFVTRINTSQTGGFGTYDYELRVPALLRSYTGSNDVLTLYVEII